MFKQLLYKYYNPIVSFVKPCICYIFTYLILSVLLPSIVDISLIITCTSLIVLLVLVVDASDKFIDQYTLREQQEENMYKIHKLVRERILVQLQREGVNIDEILKKELNGQISKKSR